MDAKELEKTKSVYARERETFLRKADESQKTLQTEKDRLFQQQIQLRMKELTFLERQHKDTQLALKRQEVSSSFRTISFSSSIRPIPELER